ncbi:single-stranded DNA-binding protein [Solwaraspora sp. WMMB335]|uniref:single-stranded DNA-binding protein n=1 Tax=Solwaraspora sp. WMMB335 TaxID=3404118 RepID=UPI003B95AF65
MFDTYVTVVGNVLTTPEWRRTTQTNTLVANFKVASTSRRLDRENNRWVDGNSLRVRVNCWRKLAEGVASSIMLGDPVVVVGRLYTRDWVDGDGNSRLQYEMEAVAVGHDLARGRGRFMRNRPTLATSEVNGDDPERRVQGEATADVPPDQAPSARNELFDADDDPTFLEPSVPSPVEGEPARTSNGRPAVTLAVDVLAAQTAAEGLPSESLPPGNDGMPAVDEEPPAPPAGSAGDEDPDGDGDGDADRDVDRAAGQPVPPSRSRRSRGRVPVPA